MRLYKLPDTVFSIKGNAAGFLNGITSNTVDAPLNAFLNQHGRIIATFYQEKLSGDEFLISVPVVAVDNLLKHLERYIKLSRVTVSPSGQSTFMDVDTGRVVWTAERRDNSLSRDEFTLFRLNRSIPLMGVDYQADEFILNVHEQKYVSYTKGCFLGQEPVAKVHNRSQPTRRLIVAFEDQLPVEEVNKMTSKIKDPAYGRVKGFVFVGHKFIASSLPTAK